MGWTKMRLSMKLTGLKNDLSLERAKRSSLQKDATISKLQKEIADLEKQMKNVKDD